jgi:hypothetical protein
MSDIEVIYCSKNLSFSWATLWTALSAIGTFTASFLALYISGGFKRVIINVKGYSIDENTFENKNDGGGYQQISVYNVSQRKIRLQDFGYMVGNKKYTTKNHTVTYDLERPNKERIQNNDGSYTIKTKVNARAYTLPFYILDGEECQFALFPPDYFFDEKMKKKRIYIYLKINEKYYKYYTKITLRKFLEKTKKLTEKSPFNR